MLGLTPWKFSICLCILGAIIVFALNLSALIWATTTKNLDQDSNTARNDGIITFRGGRTYDECAQLKSANLWLHLLINILSTVLLASSNYCMQCLSAPSRADVDRAHIYGDYLDVGIPSIHNLYRISIRRVILWLILGLSSLPLHLFYNSAVTMSASSNNYVIFSVGENFMSASNVSGFSFQDHSDLMDSGWSTSRLNTPNTTIAKVASSLLQANKNDSLIRLEKIECMHRYVNTFQNNYRNLFLVTNNNTKTIKYAEARYYKSTVCRTEQAFAWVCAYATQRTSGYSNQCTSTCDETSVFNKIEAAISNNSWTPLLDPVAYCLAEPTKSNCKLQFSVGIMIAVAVLNLVKVLAMMATFAFAFRNSDSVLLSNGDAIASFLERPDPTTKRKSLLSSRAFHDLEINAKLQQNPYQPMPIEYSERKLRWYKAASGRRWSFSILAYIAGLATAIGFLGTGISSMTGDTSISSLARLGFGAVNGRTIILTDTDASGASGLVQKAFTANVAQLILSLLYFTYNALFTAMLSAREWDTYAVRRQALRITSSKRIGVQRNSYFLQLPYRWAVPLIVLSLVLHWIISQSIFVVNVTMLDYFGNPFKTGPNNVGQLLTCGYSPIAIITFVIVAGLAIIVLIVTSFRRFESSIPIIRNNSFGISAACHPVKGAQEQSPQGLSLQKLQWGVIEETSVEPSIGSDTVPSREASESLLQHTIHEPLPYEFYGPSSVPIFNDRTDSTIALLPLGSNEGSGVKLRRCGFSPATVTKPVSGQLYA